MPLGLSKKCSAIAPSATLAMDARAKELRSQGVNVIGFAAGEPDFETPDPIREAMKEAMDLGMTRYTPAAGTLELRRAIAARLLEDHGLVYGMDEIIVSNGAKHSLYNTFQAILDPGDEVIVDKPCWVSYPEMVRMAGGVDILLTHAPPRGYGDAEDFAHRGFEAFFPFLDRFKPRYLIHGHVHMNYGRDIPRQVQRGETTIINAWERFVLEV